MRRKPCYIRVPIQISNRVRDLKERSISRRLLPGSTCRSISFTTWHFGTDLSYPIRSNDQSGMAASAFSKGCRWYFIFRNLNNSRIIRRIRDFRILDVDVSPHLNSYKTVSTPLRCRFDCASVLSCPILLSGSCCRASDRAYRMPRQLPRYVDSARSNCLFGILDPQNSRIALREDGRLYPIVSRETIVVTINIAANFARACLRLIDFRFMALCLAPPRFAKTLQLRNCHRCVRPRSDRIRRFGCLA